MIVSPLEALELKKNLIPKCIFEAIDQLIIDNFNGTKAIVYQDDILDLIDIPRSEVFKNHYLDIEPYYEKRGWKVEYSKADMYDFNGKSGFIFAVSK